MGVGFTTIMWDEEQLLDGLGDIAAAGYDGVEMGLGEAQALGTAALADALDRHGLDLYMLMCGWLESEEAADAAVQGASVVADLGAPFVGVLPPHRGTATDEEFERWLDRFCDAAADQGVTPLLHHHGGTKVESPDEIGEWLDRAPDNLELLFDTAHHYPYGEHYPDGDVTDGVERFADDIAYVHLKDVDPGSNFDGLRDELTAGNFKLDVVFLYYQAFTDLHDGVIDFDGVRAALDDAGYDGHYTIEIERQTTDPLVHAKRNLDHWRER